VSAAQTATTPPSPPPRRIEGLDLLRGVAIALVLSRHAWPGAFQGAGVAGVVVFFALSGYLITGILLRELRATGRIGLRRFYVRRIRRLVPALVAMTAGFGLVTLTLDPLGDQPELVRSVAVALTYTADLPFHRGSSAFFHLWTLALEEQFYLVWPALLIVAWRRRAVVTTIVLSGAACLLACLATLVWLSPDADLAYSLPTSWAICLVFGAGTRLISDRLPRAGVLDPTSGPTGAVSAFAIAALALASVIPLRGNPFTYLVGGPVIAALACVLLIAWRSWSVVQPRLLRPLVALGTISYGVYLWNYPITLWLRPSMGGWAGVAGIALSIAAAALSWRHIEQPIMRRGRSTPTAATPDPAGVAA
jgi:peptidoglycan/LPS O-acetylase OafA/YrhL